MTGEPLRVRSYGPPGPTAVVLHGGPGAPGSAAPLARALADPLHVLEPLQRWSSRVPLTVEQHVRDLADVLSRETPGYRPALVGESWGAMLALAFASRHPDRVSGLVLVGCGTFDAKGHAESWSDMLRLEAAGAHPAAFASIRCPVLMLHGSYDPHPGAMIRDGLSPHIPQLEYRELHRCGHSPWVEAFARERFLATTRGWLERHLR